MANPLNLIGERFARLVVVKQANPRIKPCGKPERRWACICDCGTATDVPTARLTSGKTTSCGCFHREQQIAQLKTHGMRHTSEYESWASMKDRCLNERSARFHLWGGRGISICREWKESFEQFFADMGPKPPGCTLDRIDNSGNYEPGNCRWATPSQQANNLRTTRRFAMNGSERTITEWAAIWGCSRDAIKLRLRRGQSFAEVAAALGR